MTEAGSQPRWLAPHPSPTLFCSVPSVGQVSLFPSGEWVGVAKTFDPILTPAFLEPDLHHHQPSRLSPASAPGEVHDMDEVLCLMANPHPSPAWGRVCPPETAQLSALGSRAVSPKASCQHRLPVPAPTEPLTGQGSRLLYLLLTPGSSPSSSLSGSFLVVLMKNPCVTLKSCQLLLLGIKSSLCWEETPEARS